MCKQQRVKILVSFLTAAALIFTTVSAMAGMVVDGQWLKARAGNGNIKIIDVQSKAAAYDEGHISGALRVTPNVDLEDYTRYTPNKYPQKEQFLDLMAKLGIDNDDIVVAYDAHHGIFAGRFLFIMELYGHDTDKLKMLDGGIVQWKKDNNSVTSEMTKSMTSAPYQTSGANSNLLVSYNNVLRDAVQGQVPNVIIHDARPDKEFSGETIRAIRGGHIPGALNLTGQDAANDEESQLFKPVEQIRTAYLDAGITPDKTIYTYCHSSYRAAHAYLVMTHILGYKNVKIYDGAWKEWAILTAFPAHNETWLAQQEIVKQQ